MKPLITIILLLSALVPEGVGQQIMLDQNSNAWGQGGAASGASLNFPDIKGTVTENFELVVSGTAPSTITANMFGCMRGGTCSSALATSSGTSNQILTPTSSGLYDFYKGTVSWTGGDATTQITINRSGTVARKPSSGGGSGTVSNCASSGLPYYAASGTTVICDPNITLDGSGNLTTTGKVTAGTAGGAPAITDKSIGYLSSSMAVQSTASPTNVTNMTWSIAANKNYVLSCEVPILFVASATLAFALNGPGSPTSATISHWGATTSSSAFFESDVQGQTTWANVKTVASAAPGAVTRVYHVRAQIQNGGSTGVPLTLQTIANGTNNIQVLADAACTLTQAN